MTGSQKNLKNNVDIRLTMAYTVVMTTTQTPQERAGYVWCSSCQRYEHPDWHGPRVSYEGRPVCTCHELQSQALTPFVKVTLAMPSDDVPLVGRVANGGGTFTAPESDPQVAKLLAKGHRVIRRWLVDPATRTSTDLPLL